MKKLLFTSLTLLLTTAFVGAQNINHSPKNNSKSLWGAHRSYQKALVQIFDSTYAWPWDTLTNTWSLNPKGRNINYVYDMNSNLISFLSQ